MRSDLLVIASLPATYLFLGANWSTWRHDTLLHGLHFQPAVVHAIEKAERDVVQPLFCLGFRRQRRGGQRGMQNNLARQGEASWARFGCG